MTINRRDILKLSAGVLIASLSSSFLFAQPAKTAAPAAGEAGVVRLDGNISYNAGWVVPVEDKPALLDLEAKKTKERDDLAKQQTAGADSRVSPKDGSRSLGERFQEMLGKIKSFF